MWKKEVIRNDKHGHNIAQNRSGLLRGVQVKYDSGIITAEQRKEILGIIREKDLTLLNPLLYIVDKSKVDNSRILKVSRSMRASPTSTEYKIMDLRKSEFDVLNLY